MKINGICENTVSASKIPFFLGLMLEFSDIFGVTFAQEVDGGLNRAARVDVDGAGLDLGVAEQHFGLNFPVFGREKPPLLFLAIDDGQPQRQRTAKLDVSVGDKLRIRVIRRENPEDDFVVFEADRAIPSEDGLAQRHGFSARHELVEDVETPPSAPSNGQFVC